MMRPFRFNLNLFPVEVACGHGVHAIVPRLSVYLGPDFLFGPACWTLRIGLGARRRASPGEMFHKWSTDIPVRWPVTFLRGRNVHPSRAWTGRTTEVYAIEYGFGWRRRIKFLGFGP